MAIIEGKGTVKFAAGPVITHDPYLTRVKLEHHDAIEPTRAHPTDAGLDLHSVEQFTLNGGEQLTVSTGISIAVPMGFVGLVCPRSGLASKHGITVVNAPGVIDSAFTGILKVILLNTSKNPMSFNVGDRIAQLLLTPVLINNLTVVDDLPETDRGEKGFGSSGT